MTEVYFKNFFACYFGFQYIPSSGAEKKMWVGGGGGKRIIWGVRQLKTKEVGKPWGGGGGEEVTLPYKKFKQFLGLSWEEGSIFNPELGGRGGGGGKDVGE